jgi:hypothetical protein
MDVSTYFFLDYNQNNDNSTFTGPGRPAGTSIAQVFTLMLLCCGIEGKLLRWGLL